MSTPYEIHYKIRNTQKIDAKDSEFVTIRFPKLQKGVRLDWYSHKGSIVSREFTYRGYIKYRLQIMLIDIKYWWNKNV